VVCREPVVLGGVETAWRLGEFSPPVDLKGLRNSLNIQASDALVSAKTDQMNSQVQSTKLEDKLLNKVFSSVNEYNCGKTAEDLVTVKNTEDYNNFMKNREEDEERDQMNRLIAELYNQNRSLGDTYDKKLLQIMSNEEGSQATSNHSLQPPPLNQSTRLVAHPTDEIEELSPAVDSHLL